MAKRNSLSQWILRLIVGWILIALVIYPNLNLLKEIFYKNGHLIRFQVYDEKGSLIKDIKE